MLRKLKSKSGEVIVIAMVGSVLLMCGLSYLKSIQKGKTIDTVANPAVAEYDR